MYTHRSARIDVFGCAFLAMCIFASLATADDASLVKNNRDLKSAIAPPTRVAERTFDSLERDYSARAQDDIANPMSANDPQHLAARMSNIERVNIRIPGLAAISGQYRINGDGTIAVPGIGRLKVDNMLVTEFEKQLAYEVQRISNQQANVAVEIVDYRPVFVSGNVVRSGAFPWKPGYSVLHAETLAGGLYRGRAAPAAGSPDPHHSHAVHSNSMEHQRERAVRAAYELAAAIATEARLKLEMVNETAYSLPSRVAALATPRGQDTLFSAQQAILQSRVSIFNAEVEAAKNARAIALKEKKAFEDQILRIQKQLTKRRSLAKKIAYMANKRFARGDTLFTEQVRVAELEERMTTTTLAISRAEMAANAAQKKLETLSLKRKAEIDTQLLALEEKKAELEIAIDSANNIYRHETGHDALASKINQPMVPRYEIVRNQGGRTKVISVDRGTLIIPGDVVIVSLGLPNPS